MESDIKKEIKWCMQKEEQVSSLAEKIRQADAVLIGCGSGLSSAAGYNHYHWLPYMEECLQDFKEWYGLKSPFDGFYYCYSSRNNSGHIMHVTYKVCGMHLQDSHTMTCVILWRKKKSLF